jgi:hypothetical protein
MRSSTIPPPIPLLYGDYAASRFGAPCPSPGILHTFAIRRPERTVSPPSIYGRACNEFFAAA